MAPLVDALAFEYELFHVPHRLPVRSAFKAQRLFRWDGGLAAGEPDGGVDRGGVHAGLATKSPGS